MPLLIHDQPPGFHRVLMGGQVRPPNYNIALSEISVWLRNPPKLTARSWVLSILRHLSFNSPETHETAHEYSLRHTLVPVGAPRERRRSRGCFFPELAQQKEKQKASHSELPIAFTSSARNGAMLLGTFRSKELVIRQNREPTRRRSGLELPRFGDKAGIAFPIGNSGRAWATISAMRQQPHRPCPGRKIIGFGWRKKESVSRRSPRSDQHLEACQACEPVITPHQASPPPRFWAKGQFSHKGLASQRRRY